jgi:NAD dependent epimerase/dehydratase
VSGWSGRKVLVTGAGGFIGSHLTEALVRRGASVRAFLHYNSRSDWGLLGLAPSEVRAEIDARFGEITDPWSIDAAVDGCEILFHLAALIAIPYSYIAPASYVDVNVTGTLNVLQSVRARGVGRIVHTSTSETYGTAQYTPIDEEHPLQGQSPYSASKIAADKVAESFHRSFGTPVAIIRPFNTYGPRQSARAVIPTIASQALSGLPVLKLGSLEPIRDLSYIDDTVEGFLAVAQSQACIGQVTNIGMGEGITIGDLARLVLRMAGRAEMPIETDQSRVRPESSEVFQLICDNSKARERCGWQPKISLESGLERTVESIRHSLALYRPATYTV